MTFIRTLAALPAALALTGAAFCTPAQAQNLLQNGSFEQGTFTDNGNGAQGLNPGATAISGWTTTNAELAWLVNGNAYNLATPYGSYFLDLTGYHDQSPYGGVTQTIATTAGQAYQLSFALGSDPGQDRFAGPVSATASAGSASQSFTFTPANGSENQWQLFSLAFVATGSSTPITIIGTGAGNQGEYLGLDNVSVTSNAPVPEASTTVSFGLLLALGGLAVIARRRRTAPAA